MVFEWSRAFHSLTHTKEYAATAFSSFSDGLDPSRRSREHVVTNINLEDDRCWVPYADGVWLQPCHGLDVGELDLLVR